MSKTYFITTTIPYVNAQPHIGHAQEFVLADTIARFYLQKGKHVILQSGTDENAYKNVLSAKKLGVSSDTFVENNSKNFLNLLNSLSINANIFVRTSAIEHKESVHYFFKKIKTEDTYTCDYKSLYCQGCEDFYQERDLINGKCPDHDIFLEPITENNVFFRLSKYQDKIYHAIESDQVLIKPQSKKKEILSFIKSGLVDISLSRSKARSEGWGIAYPGHEDQVVYVWIDALINYLSGIGYGRDNQWKNIWNEETHKIHVIGKNVWKFHAVYWLGLLLSADLALPNEILIHGFLTNEGIKISKSLGNGSDPLQIIERYGSDAVRFYLLKVLSYKQDSDFIEDNLKKSYNSELANKFGNLVSRLFSLKYRIPQFKYENKYRDLEFDDFEDAFARGFELINQLNQEINNTKPWELLKSNNFDDLNLNLAHWLSILEKISFLLFPLLPNGCRQLNNLFKDESNEITPLYPRI